MQLYFVVVVYALQNSKFYLKLRQFMKQQQYFEKRKSDVMIEVAFDFSQKNTSESN